MAPTLPHLLYSARIMTTNVRDNPRRNICTKKVAGASIEASNVFLVALSGPTKERERERGSRDINFLKGLLQMVAMK